MSAAPDPVPGDVLDELVRRLRATRPVRLPVGVGWDRGTDADYLAELVGHWADSYDWRAHEDRIRALPWVAAGGLRAVHQRAAADDATAVVLLHGWPDLVLRFAKVWPLLTDVHVVVPALPGYPFSEPHTEVGMSTTAMGRMVVAMMAELGYERYVVSGGDIGGSVAESIAATHPDRVAALHMTDVPLRHILAVDPDELTEAERAYRDSGERWRQREGAYLTQQSTKPHSLAVGLNDSPAGLAAWIVEKLRSWSDSHGDVETVFPRDDLLTWLTAYWVTGSIGTSFSPYFEPRDRVDRVDVPAVFSIFPQELVHAPREFAERFFDVRVWDEPTAGGHFGAWEQPEVFTAALRSAIDLAS